MKKHIISLIIGFALIAIGTTMAAFNILSFDYDETPGVDLNDLAVIKKDIIVNDYLKIFLPKMSDVSYIKDETLGNEITIKIYYNDEILHLNYQENDNNFMIDGYYKKNVFHISKNFLNTLKKAYQEKTIHDYTYLIVPKVEIYGSNLNKEKLIIKKDDDHLSNFDNDFDFEFDIFDFE